MSIKEFNRHFWDCAAERAIRAFAQTAVAMLGVKTFLSEIDGVVVLSASALAALIAVLNSIVEEKSDS